MTRGTKQNTKELKILAVDFEIAKQIPASSRDFFKHSPLGITVGATFDPSEDDGPVAWYEMDAEGKPKAQCSPAYLRVLLGYLRAKISEGYTLLTWNGLKFDFRLLAEETGEGLSCSLLAASDKHIDMMYHYFCVTGYPVAMQAVAEGMDVPGKKRYIDGKKVPTLWKQGHYDDVIEYAKQDAQTIVDIYNALTEKGGKLHWYTNRGNLNNRYLGKWLSVQDASVLRPPAKAIWEREEFFTWIESFVKVNKIWERQTV